MKNYLLIFTLACLLLLSGCAKTKTSPDEPMYYLTIAEEGVYTVLVSTASSDGGCRNADRSPFQKGEQVWLEQLDSRPDLRGVTVTALDRDGAALWQCAIPDTEAYADVTTLTDGNWSIRQTESADSSPRITEQPQPSAAPQETEIRRLDAQVLENREKELVFSISMEDFMESYNSLYLRDKGKAYLGSKDQWRRFTYEEAIHSDHETSLYEFSIDEQVWSQPTVTVFVPTNAPRIQEITLNYDAHGHSDAFYEEFEELCFYTLKVFFPDLEDESITALYREANELGDLHIFPKEEGYEKGCTPAVLYHKNGLGVYPYFAIGEWGHLCIIPVSPERIEEFKQQGVDVREIP